MFEYLLNSSEILLFILISCSVLSVLLIRKFGITPGGVLPSGVFALIFLRDPPWALLILLASISIYLISRSFLFSSEGFTSIFFCGIFLLLFLLVFEIYGVFSSLVFLLSGTLLIVFLFGSLSNNFALNIFQQERFNLDYMQFGLAIVIAFVILQIYPVSYLQAGGLMIAPVLSRNCMRNGFNSTFFGFLACAASGLAISYCIINVAELFGTNAALSINQGQIFESYYVKVIPYLAIISLTIGAISSKVYKVRAGGYILAPFAAQIISDTNGPLIILLGVIFTVSFQALLIERLTWMIGLSRYLFVLIISSLYSIIVCGQYIALGHSVFIVANTWIIALIIHGTSNDIIVYGRKAVPLIVLNFGLTCFALKIFEVVPFA